MEYVLRTNVLSKMYKKSYAVDEVSMCVPRGEIYGFVGRNGAGKTTLMRLVCGLINKASGEYELFGRKDSDRGIAAARRRVGAVIEAPSLYPEMTAWQNLTEQCLVLDIDPKKAVPAALEYVGLTDTGKKKVRHFSLGMRQRLGIAVAMVGSPDFLILDEPTNGLDPQGIVGIRELLLRLNRERGVTVLISSHILGELSKLATCYGFIERGRMVKEITAAQLEAACRKSIALSVSSTEKLPYILERGLNISDFRILSDTEAEIYGEVNIGDLSMALHAGGVRLLRLHEKDEDLESYFLNLIGGED